MAPAMPMGTDTQTTAKPMPMLCHNPSSKRWSSLSFTNHSVVKHSQGVARGKVELLKAEKPMMSSGPKR